MGMRGRLQHRQPHDANERAGHDCRQHTADPIYDAGGNVVDDGANQYANDAEGSSCVRETSVERQLPFVLANSKFEITKKHATGATIYDKTHFNWAGS
jgi:hypothetical protein